jgi:VanZ family protein
LFCIVVIVIESTEMLGAEHTSNPLRWVFEALFGRVGDRSWNSIHHILRKSGHFLGYGTIGLIWLRAWWMSLPRSRFLQDAFLSLMGTAMIASADELHQSILPNRTGTPWDVVLDCSGALALQLIVYIYMRLWHPKRLERAA